MDICNKCIFVICIFLYILAYKTYILHISFVHIWHIFCIFGTAFSCIFWNAYFCIFMHIMHISANCEFACRCIIYISFRHSLDQIGDVGFCGRFRAWFKVSRDQRKKPDWSHLWAQVLFHLVVCRFSLIFFDSGKPTDRPK